MLKTAIAQRRRVVICIDGLDESLVAHRAGLLRALKAIVRELPNVQLFLTGRPFVRSEVESYFLGADTISVSLAREDTEAFLRMKLDEDPEPDPMDESLRKDIMEIIPETISEIFLLVSLSVEAILGETTIRRRREKLKQISNGQDVGDVYTATLERIRAQGEDRARLGMEAIMWLAYSERSLESEELCQALGVEIESVDLDSDNTPSIRTILNCGLGLVTVDSLSSKVRLVHFTLQEHILANHGLFYNPHSMIAEVCLTYLNFGCIKALSPALRSPPPITPFLEYASRYWGAHARRQISTSVISLALKLFDRFDAHICCELLLRREFENSRWRSAPPMGCTALHAGAFLGILEIMVSLLKINKWELNATDGFGRTALMWATKMGHDAIVKVLLEQEGVDPHIVDCGGKTLLSWATENGCGGIAEMLLVRNDVNPDKADWSGRTPLSYAAATLCVETVKMLLKRKDVNPDRVDKRGKTPLSWAAGAWCVENVKILLERNDVNPDRADESGRTPLSYAAENVRKETMKMLLERNDVNPDTTDKSGRTPLSWAAGNGREAIAEMLLERTDVNPDTADEDGRTPLSWAATWRSGIDGFEGWNERLVNRLLGRNDVNPDRSDKSSRTPLSWAAEDGREKIVQMLLERNDVNPDQADKSGPTPLSWAAENGWKEIVKMLLERNDVNPDTADDDGRTPLSWAARPGTWSITVLSIFRL